MMKSTKIDTLIQRAVADIHKQYPVIREIVNEINAHEGVVFLVGGAVRDLFLGLPIKDLDIEIHGIPLQELQALLQRFGDVSLVGKSFGVLRYPGLAIDFSIPRTDSTGRKPEVVLNHSMPIQDAFVRRDLTINAMGIDLKTGKLVDPFNGIKDLQEGSLRAPDIAFFIQDPLRLFRVMQFISRFNMYPEKKLSSICKKMEIDGISRERIEQEFEKMLLKSKQPSLGIRWLNEIGRLEEVLPELAETIGIKQDPIWHPEGDVFEHTMQTIDAAAAISLPNNYIRKVLLYAAMCHDLGKVSSTGFSEQGKVISHGHDVQGIEKTRQLMRRITNNKDLIDAVSKLVRYHMAPLQFVDNDATPAAYKRLANKLAPHCSLSLLADLALADRRGRNPKGIRPLEKQFDDITRFRKIAENIGVLNQTEQPLLQGRDIQDLIEPGPEMGKLLQKAYEIQLQENIKSKEELRKRIMQEME